MSRAPRLAHPREHKATAPTTVGCFVLTISDTKTPETDTSGAVIRELLAAAGHPVIGSAIVRDEPADVARVVREACADARVQVVLLTGGTGITSRDSTFEAVEALLDKRLPGFGELFRCSPTRRSAPRPCSRGPRWASTPGASSSPCRARPTPAGWRSRSCCIPELGHLVREVSR